MKWTDKDIFDQVVSEIIDELMKIQDEKQQLAALEKVKQYLIEKLMETKNESINN